MILPGVFAELKLPPNLAKVNEFNKAFAEKVAGNISFGIAFLAGVMTFLSPCVLPILLMFIASSLHSGASRFLFFMTGMSTALMLMGVVVGYLGGISLDLFPFKEYLAQFAGAFFVLLGMMLISNISFKGISVPHRPSGSYAAGFLFAFGWTACTGPVLAGVLAMGALMQDVMRAGMLLFVYSLGIGFPFLLMAIIYSGSGLKLKWLNSKTRFSRYIGGMLYMAIGIVLLFFKDTAIFNALQYGLTGYYYISQDVLLAGSPVLTYLGIVSLLVFAVIAYIIVWRRRDTYDTLLHL